MGVSHVDGIAATAANMIAINAFLLIMVHVENELAGGLVQPTGQPNSLIAEVYGTEIFVTKVDLAFFGGPSTRDCPHVDTPGRRLPSLQ